MTKKCKFFSFAPISRFLLGIFLFELIHLLPNIYQSCKKSANIFILWYIQALSRLFETMDNTILFWYLISTETWVLALLPFVRIPSLNHTCILNAMKQLYLFLDSYALISGEQGHFRQIALKWIQQGLYSSLDLFILKLAV